MWSRLVDDLLTYIGRAYQYGKSWRWFDDVRASRSGQGAGQNDGLRFHGM
jgi:hypothetical protein